MSDMWELEFRGNRGDSGPTTWAQREQWATLVANRPYNSRFNMWLLHRLPGGVSHQQVRESLETLLECHETLRTLFASQGADPPTQLVIRVGTMPLRVVQAEDPDGRLRAQKVMAELSSIPFDQPGELPVRLGVVTHNGRPLWLCGALSHLAVDVAAVGILRQQLHGLLTGADSRGTIGSGGHQPLEQAGYEQSAKGQAVLNRSLNNWRAGFEAAPRSLFRTAMPERPGPRYPVMSLYAKNLGGRARSIATDLRVGVSAVFTAAAAAALAAAAGVDGCGLIVTCSNRASPQTRGYVGAVAQQGLVPVDVIGVSFYDLVRRVWTALLFTYRTSSYDLDALDALFHDITMVNGTTIDHYVNVISQDEPLRVPADARELADGATIVREEEPIPSTRLHFGLAIVSDGRDVTARLFADQRHMPADVIAGVLRAINDIVRAGAGDDVTLPARIAR